MASIWAILRTLRGKGGILNKGVTWFHLSFKKMILVGCGDQIEEVVMQGQKQGEEEGGSCYDLQGDSGGLDWPDMKWLHSGFSLKACPIGFADRLIWNGGVARL